MKNKYLNLQYSNFHVNNCNCFNNKSAKNNASILDHWTSINAKWTLTFFFFYTQLHRDTLFFFPRYCWMLCWYNCNLKAHLYIIRSGLTAKFKYKIKIVGEKMFFIATKNSYFFKFFKRSIENNSFLNSKCQFDYSMPSSIIL